jgi:aromatic-L-amino-acid/L-tryptophan decarboxylase
VLNQRPLDRIQAGGELFLSNGVVRGNFARRMCIVNFRATQADVIALPDLVVLMGGRVHEELRPAGVTETECTGGKL